MSEETTPPSNATIPNQGISDVKVYAFDDLKNLLGKIDSPEVGNIASQMPSATEQSEFDSKLSEFLDNSSENNKTVLGIDIYKYSQFKDNQQKMIPFIFSLLRQEAIKTFFDCEPFFSNGYTKQQMEDDMIDSGDGGYLFFNTPIDAIIFLMYFNTFIHLFNSYHLYPKLRKYVGSITIRYAITHNSLYKIDSNFYGAAIIHNARIISKDQLNRCLIDNKTYEWFLLNTNGIETLPHTNINDLAHLKPYGAPTDSLFFSDDYAEIRNVFCQKLEKIHVKEDDFDIYNLIIQSFLSFYPGEDENKLFPFISTIGNMNCNGI